VQFNLQNVAFAKEQMEMLKAQNKVLAQAAGEIDIDDLADLQDEAADHMADMADIQEVMSRDYSGVSVDEATINDELAALDGMLDSIPDTEPPVASAPLTDYAMGGALPNHAAPANAAAAQAKPAVGPAAYA
jgi:hypothetical protein